MIVIEAFAFGRKQRREQAAALAQAVMEAGALLETTRPVTFRNFANPADGATSILRAVLSRTIDGFLLRDPETTGAGIGTITRKLCIVYPGTSEEEPKPHLITADSMDIWTVPSIGEAGQKQGVRALLAKVATPTVLAIMSQDERQLAACIPPAMEAIGPPGRVRVPEGYGDYGLPKIQAPLQVYTADVAQMMQALQ